MPRELITVQVGQCGLQVGTKFWDLVLREHAAAASASPIPVFDSSMSSFFRHVDARVHPVLDLGVSDPPAPLQSLRARAVLVDMEEGVLSELKRSDLAELFDTANMVQDVSGSGNNWAHGHHGYGPQYMPSILEAVRRAVEPCDSLQAFFLLHSLGGGTGSGLGTAVLAALDDAYPDVYRFVSCVAPSEQDDVITSPYNSTLAMHQLIQHADAVMPIHNQALIDICAKINKESGSGGSSSSGAASSSSSSSAGSSATNTVAGHSLIDLDPSTSSTDARVRRAARRAAFSDMNTIAAQLLSSLTCGMRFDGELNVDLNELTMNLVPFPRMHFLLSSLAPIGREMTGYGRGGKAAPPMKFGLGGTSSSSSGGAAPSSFDPRIVPSSSAQPASSSSSVTSSSKSIDAMFSQLFHPSSFLVKSSPDRPLVGRGSGIYLAAGLFARGPDLSVSDLTRNITRLKMQHTAGGGGSVRMIPWNSEGFKTGLCGVSPVGTKRSVLALTNSTRVADLFHSISSRAHMLYVRRAHFHHYTEYMEEEDMDRALEASEQVVRDYMQMEYKAEDAFENGGSSMGAKRRMKPVI